MRYYKVWVASAAYHGDEALTYSYEDELTNGAVVRVSLRNKGMLGIIISNTTKPDFAVKPLELVSAKALPKELLSLAEWIKHYYAAPIGSIARLLLPSQLTEKQLSDNPKFHPQENPKASTLPKLTSEQDDALKKINKPGSYLLHGRTGSGKTRVYIELAARLLKEDRSAIILTPEISLTEQLLSNFRSVFGSRVVVIHSNLTESQRREIWLSINHSKVPLVVIGPRSALFSPLRNIGLIVVDESHENSYKQEQTPYYHANRVAAKLAELHSAILVLGSATPSVVDYYLAEKKGRPIVRMNQTAIATKSKVSVDVVDMAQKTSWGRSRILSTRLIDAIKLALDKGEQSLLFLNRRGTARLVVCDNCGWQAMCPHCGLPLAFHGDSFNLRCHTCGFHEKIVSTCPSCGNPSVTMKSIGTKAVSDEVNKLFPSAQIMRFDSDNIKSERLESHYHSIKNGEVDIIIGTQLLAKGLDLPKLSTLGIVLADTSLYLPDYSAQERTYQLLTQVLGRIGRGHVNSTAIIQTYKPDQPILQAAINQRWQNFYDSELAQRHKYLFPPFCFTLKLTCQMASPKSAENAAITLKARILQQHNDITVDGPAPAFHEKKQSKYRWNLIIKSNQRNSLLQIIHDILPKNWKFDIDPANLL